MTFILPIGFVLLATVLVLIWSHFGLLPTVGVSLIVVMAALVDAVEPNLRL